MPSPSEPHLDERFEELAELLRETRPRASERLREQVRELARQPVVERPARTPLLRRLTPLALAVLVAAAIVGGFAVLASQTTTSGGGDESEAAATAPASAGAREADTMAQRAQPEEQAQADARALNAPSITGATLPPSRGRAQEYRAELSVRVPGVEELSGATTEAMRITRSMGGYVVSARYEEPGDADGDSYLVVRVPVNRVQNAIMRFSELGAIIAQHISVVDLQAQLDRQADTIAALRATIDRLETQLADPNLDPETRERLRLQLLEAKRNLRAREGGHAQTKRRAATARISLTLTTREQAEPVAPPTEENGFAGTLKDALSILGAVLTWTLAALIVASPAIVLLALLLVALRMRRRAEERRLLERPAG